VGEALLLLPLGAGEQQLRASAAVGRQRQTTLGFRVGEEVSRDVRKKAVYG
jgi:hypothetical protein